MTRSLLTYSQKQLIVKLASKFKRNKWRELRIWLFKQSPKDFPWELKDVRDKLRSWRKDAKPEGHECSFGDRVDVVVAHKVDNIVDRGGLMNIDILREILEESCLQFDPSFNIDTCGYFYGPSWGKAWAKRHGFPSGVASVAGTSFSKANM